MAGSYDELSAAFNQSARDFVRMEPDATWLVTRYHTLLKFKASTDEEKTALVNTLCTCFEDYLKKYTPDTVRWIAPEAEKSLTTIASALKDPESIHRIPEGASKRIADLAIDLLDQAERMEKNDTIPYNRREEYFNKMTRIAGIALSTAEAMQTAARDLDVKTSKNISPAKRITLKAADKGPQ